MYYIAVCDDNKNDLNLLSNHLCELKKEYIQSEVLTFNNGGELVEYHKNGRRFDLIVLDMCMVPINGIETASEIRKYDQDVPILIVSNSDEFALDGYCINACRYMLKPVNCDYFISQVKKILQNSSRNPQQNFTFSGENGITRVMIKDIYYFQSNLRSIKLATRQGEYCFIGRISSIAKQMEPFGFMRVHKSYVVNFNNIKNLFKETITMDDGFQIPYSKNKSKEVHQKFIEYMEKAL